MSSLHPKLAAIQSACALGLTVCQAITPAMSLLGPCQTWADLEKSLGLTIWYAHGMIYFSNP